MQWKKRPEQLLVSMRRCNTRTCSSSSAQDNQSAVIAVHCWR
jgi:hypothetical protein